MASFVKFEDWPESLAVEKAKNELNEDENTREQDIQEFRNMVQNGKVAEFTRINMDDDEFLLKFLRARKFDTKRGISLLKNYLNCREKFSDLYQVLNNEREKVIAKMKENKVIGALPHRNQDGCAVIYLRIENWKTEFETMPDFALKFLLTFESLSRDPVTQVNGAIFIMDAKGTTFSHLRTASIRWLLFSRALIQNAMPLRIKEIHLVNQTWFFDQVINLLWPFLSSKMKKRFHFIGEKFQKLHEFVPKEILPEEIGGTAGPFNCDWWCEKLTDMKDQNI